MPPLGREQRGCPLLEVCFKGQWEEICISELLASDSWDLRKEVRGRAWKMSEGPSLSGGCLAGLVGPHLQPWLWKGGVHDDSVMMIRITNVL